MGDPLSVKAQAQALPKQAWQTISWRQGTNDTLSGRFATVRMRHAGGTRAGRGCGPSNDCSSNGE